MNHRENCDETIPIAQMCAGGFEGLTPMKSHDHICAGLCYCVSVTVEGPAQIRARDPRCVGCESRE